MKLKHLTKLNIPGYNISENEKYIYQYDIIERDSRTLKLCQTKFAIMLE